MGMDDLIRRPQPPKELPFEIRLGEAQNSVLCQSCRIMKRAGIFVIYKSYTVLVCMQCLATGIVKYQDLHLGSEKVFQVDAEVPPELMERAVAQVIEENKDLPENIVAKIARSAIEKI
jgi:hypothetical protein